jgi:predicted hotdog family 3-hydroxylacyl-ACP dehydratase
MMDAPHTPHAPAAQLPPIASLVPHSASMLLLDRVTAADEETLQAEVAVTPHSLFAGADGVGSWIGIEYMAQAVAAYAGYHAARDSHSGGRGRPGIGFLLGTRRYTASRGCFALGSILHIHVKRLLLAENGLGSFECFIDDGAERIASATLTVFQPPDPEMFLKEGSV